MGALPFAFVMLVVLIHSHTIPNSESSALIYRSDGGRSCATVDQRKYHGRFHGVLWRRIPTPRMREIMLVSWSGHHLHDFVRKEVEPDPFEEWQTRVLTFLEGKCRSDQNLPDRQRVHVWPLMSLGIVLIWWI